MSTEASPAVSSPAGLTHKQIQTILLGLMAGMLLAGNKVFTSIAIGTMFVALCAVIGSVTVLAGVLSKAMHADQSIESDD